MTDMVILEPHSPKTDLPIPFCMVFHGNESIPQSYAEYWHPLTSPGWMAALPQSMRAGDKPGTFIWNTPRKAEWDFASCQQRSLDFILPA